MYQHERYFRRQTKKQMEVINKKHIQKHIQKQKLIKSLKHELFDKFTVDSVIENDAFPPGYFRSAFGEEDPKFLYGRKGEIIKIKGET